jgi:SAM-dependent MidA family methyltransferase
MVRWREAMSSALYGEDGFYRRPGTGPAAHFRTSAHASPLFAGAVLRLLERVDEALGAPDPLDLVDVGAGRGELLAALLAAAPPGLAARLRPTAVELAPGPPSIHWSASIPDRITGLLLATEWLDNVPLDVAELDENGTPRYVLVDTATGAEALGEPVTGPDAGWLARWWPLTVPGSRAEIGRTRDAAWTAAVDALARGAALAVDYGHLREGRPPLGTLTGYRDGNEVAPVPDGSCDITAHVAVDALGGVLCRQHEALHALGISGARPPLALARSDPGGYLHRLAAASGAAELTDPAGLGGHYWLLQPAGLDQDVARWLA